MDVIDIVFLRSNVNLDARLHLRKAAIYSLKVDTIYLKNIFNKAQLELFDIAGGY
jgi:hypothetical protein